MTDPAADAPAYLDLPDGRRIAFARTEGDGPGVVFLTGFRSDMTGSKALYLEAWAKARGRAFLRFDYTGHGASSGAFEDGAIGDWAQDAYDAVTTLTEGPQILIGSSMGGWIMLLVARRLLAEGPGSRLAGMIGVAAAPDFTEDLMLPAMSDDERAALERDGRIEQLSDYDPQPTVITKRLIEEGREQLVLRSPLRLPTPVRLLHGSVDPDVPLSVGLRLLHHIDAADARLTVVKGSGHRMSEPAELDLLIATLDEVSHAHRD